MALRFKKSVWFGRLVRLNFSGSGLSLGLGPRGFNANIGPRGVRKSVGLPGTGLSYQTFSRWLAGRPAELSTEPASQPGTQLPPQSTAASEAEPRLRRLLMKLGLAAALIYGGYLVLRPGAPTGASSPATASHQPLSPEPTLEATPAAPPQEGVKAGPAVTPVEDTRPLTIDEVREVQAWLRAFGIEPGPLDGLPGPLTAAAIKRYQAARQKPETGFLDRPLLRQLRQEAGHSGR